jgi:hypothetical protein
MRVSGGQLLCSPSDVVEASTCTHRAITAFRVAHGVQVPPPATPSDAVAVRGGEHEAAVVRLAANVRALDTHVDFAQKLVDDVQEELHDTFVDTTWPACPRHLSHPLWYRDGSWYCERDGIAVAVLGGLRSLAPDRR